MFVSSLSFCRGSRVEGSMSRVEYRVEGNFFFNFFFLEKKCGVVVVVV